MERVCGAGDSIVLRPPTVELIPVSDSAWKALQARSAALTRKREAALRQKLLDQRAQLDTICPFGLSGEPFRPFPLSDDLPSALRLGDDFPRVLPQQPRSRDAFSGGVVPCRAGEKYREELRPQGEDWQGQHAAHWGGAFVFVVLLSLASALIYVSFRSRYAELLRALLRVGSFARIEGIASLGVSLHTLLFDLLYSVLQAYVAWYGIVLAGWMDGSLPLGASGVLAFLVVLFAGRIFLQYSLSTLLGFMLGVGRFGYMLWTQGQVISRLAWPFVLLSCVVYTLTPAGVVRGFYVVALSVVGLVALVRNARLAAAFRHYEVPSYYILLYLCALEILPILLIGKWLTLY